MMTPSGNTRVGTGGARRVPVAPPNATGDGPLPAIKISLGGFLLLFIASRLLYLVLIDPSYLSPQRYEELYRGTIAQELVTGLSMPFTEYRADNYAGGSLVIGALAAGFFLLFGPTLFALKLAPLFLFTLTLAFWYWTIQRHVGERVARYFALLFCFSPPPFTTYSVTAMGFHSESIVFSALTVFLLFKMLSEEKPLLAYPVLLGLTAGFGLWFGYIYGLTLVVTLGVWLWHEKGTLRRPRVLWFALGFLVGFSPWIVINVQTHFAGLMVGDKNVWEHFGLEPLWEGLANPRRLAPYEFFANIASDDDWDLYRRAANLLYFLLYLGPILTAGVLHLKTGRSAPAGANYSGRGPREMRPSRNHPTRLTLVGFAILYVVVFALAVQLSDFRAARYYVPAYPFLFFLVAHSVARWQDRFPRVQRQIHTVFLADVVLLALGTHAPLLSLDRPGYALSTKGYAYAEMPFMYLTTHAPHLELYALTGSWNPQFHREGEREFFLELVQRPFLSDILPKLSSDDQRELSFALVQMLAGVAPLNGQAEDFARLERLVPPGFDRYLYYLLGAMAMARHSNVMPQAVAAVEFLRHQTPAMHHLALVGIYQQWPQQAGQDRTPDSLISAPAAVTPALAPHYWRALGHWAGGSWYNTEGSLSLLTARLQEFVPRLNPSVQRYVLQGVGKLLFDHFIYSRSVAPAELERFPHTYQEGLLEGWGMALGEEELYSEFPWKDQESPFWTEWTKGFSARSLVSVQRGKAQFEALFEGAASSALEPPRQAP